MFRPAPVQDGRRFNLPHFSGTAGDQLRVGERGQFSEVRFRLRHAFTPSRPVQQPAMLAGRLDVLLTLIRSIEDQQLHVVLYGERGIGKTSLLHVLSQIATDARYLVRYASCSDDMDISEFFRAILQDIPVLYHKDYSPTSQEVEEGYTFADLLPESALSVPVISEMFAKINGTRLLVILDEFDRANGPNFRRGIAELIKSLSDRGVGVQLVIAGVASNLSELIEHIPSIRRNILGMQVPNMTDAEVAEMIARAEKVSGLTYSQDAVSLICEAAYGLPHLASLLGQHAGMAAVERSSTLVEWGDVASAITQACEETRHRISANTLFYIDKACRDGNEPVLGVVAHAALHNGGRLLPDELDKVFGRAGAGLAALRDVERDYGLIRPIAHDPAGAHCFAEEGVPVYIWMRFSMDIVNGSGGTPVTLRGVNAAPVARAVPANGR